MASVEGISEDSVWQAAYSSVLDLTCHTLLSSGLQGGGEGVHPPSLSLRQDYQRIIDSIPGRGTPGTPYNSSQQLNTETPTQDQCNHIGGGPENDQTMAEAARTHGNRRAEVSIIAGQAAESGMTRPRLQRSRSRSVPPSIGSTNDDVEALVENYSHLLARVLSRFHQNSETNIPRVRLSNHHSSSRDIDGRTFAASFSSLLNRSDGHGSSSSIVNFSNIVPDTDTESHLSAPELASVLNPQQSLGNHPSTSFVPHLPAVNPIVPSEADLQHLFSHLLNSFYFDVYLWLYVKILTAPDLRRTRNQLRFISMINSMDLQSTTTNILHGFLRGFRQGREPLMAEIRRVLEEVSTNGIFSDRLHSGTMSWLRELSSELGVHLNPRQMLRSFRAVISDIILPRQRQRATICSR